MINVWILIVPLIILTFPIVLFLSILCYRIIVIGISKICHGNDYFIVTGTDGPSLPMTPTEADLDMLVIFTVKGQVSTKKLREVFEKNILNYRNSSIGEFVYKKLWHFPTNFLGFAFWKREKSFDLKNHIRDFKPHGTTEFPTNEEKLMAVAPKMLKNWHVGRSRWEILVSPQIFQNTDNLEGEKMSLIFFRFDHMICDFKSLMLMFRLLFNSPFEIPVPKMSIRPIPLSKKLKSIRGIFKFLFKSSPAFGEMTNPGKKNITQCHFSQKCDNSVIQEIRKLHDVDFSTVIHSTVSAAFFRTFYKALPETQRKDEIQMTTAYPIADHPGGLVNHATNSTTFYPWKDESCVKRLMKTQKIIREENENWLKLLFFHVSGIFGLMPSPLFRLARRIGQNNPLPVFMSNIPSTRTREFVFGMEITDVYLLASAVPFIDIEILSWGLNNQQRFTFMVRGDQNMEYHRQLSHSFMQELNELQKQKT